MTIWHEAEALSSDEARRVQNEALGQQLAYLAEQSTFYQEKIGQQTMRSVQTVDALAELPFTEKTELRASLAAAPPLGRHVAAPLESIVQVQASSGTTGSPSYVGLTARDVEVWNELGARTMFANGLRPGMWCLHAFGMGKGFVGGLPIVNILHHLRIVDLPIGAEAGVERLLRVLADARPTALVGTPNFLAYLAEQAPAVLGREASTLGVRVISTGGEPGGGIPALRKHLEQLWNADVREMLGGTDLACTYWGECEVKDGMHFHSPDLMIAELIDPVSGAVLVPREGVEGELVYTALRREASPLLRFRTHDHVVVTGTSCICGRTGFKIRVLGRTDDMLIVRGINVFPAAIQTLLLEQRPLVTGHFRIRVTFPGHSTQQALPLVVECGTQVELEATDGLARRLEEILRSALSFKAAITMVPAGTFERPGVAKVSLIQRTEVSQ